MLKRKDVLYRVLVFFIGCWEDVVRVFYVGLEFSWYVVLGRFLVEKNCIYLWMLLFFCLKD